VSKSRNDEACGASHRDRSDDENQSDEAIDARRAVIV
jgi:hypothetical protein